MRLHQDKRLTTKSSHLRRTTKHYRMKEETLSNPESSETPDEKQVASDALFARCSETKFTKDGSVQIHCKLGNWSVFGADRERVEAEARHYWRQYLSDGDYNSILANDQEHLASES